MNVEIDITNLILRTPRLLLRPFRQADLEDFYEYARVDGVGQLAGWSPHKNIEESQEILDLFIRGKNILALDYQGKVIGSIGIEKYKESYLTDFKDKRCRELGCALSKKYWGQGLMPEALNYLIDHLFEEVGLDYIFAGYFSFNTQSKRLQEKCGFLPYRKTTLTTRSGEKHKGVINILPRGEWLKRKS